MAKAVWVEGLKSPQERTQALIEEIEKSGFKLSTADFTQQLKEKKVSKYIIGNVEDARVTLIGGRYNAPTMLAYGVIRTNEHYGFYISGLKLKPEGYPEFRLVIETSQEFEGWFKGFIEECMHYEKNPDSVLVR